MRPASYTDEYEVAAAIEDCRPHVVLLGAGASYAAFPNGDKNGRKLPLLRDFVGVIGLEDLMSEAGVSPPYDDFEAMYSDIAADSKRAHVRSRIDSAVLSYFQSLELPDEPTLYDHLVLSLRPKDVIATFNWDPFLWQACQRNRSFGGAPCLLFLHGSVSIGRCNHCQNVSARGALCPTCGNALDDVPILFPVTQKDYNSDAAIAEHWRTLKRTLKAAYALTVFGYSAPKTDVEAVELMKEGWGTSDERNMEEIEIIDIRDEESLRSSWDEFIHTHHYTIKPSFYDSCIARHPRRSCEALWARLMENTFICPFPIPRAAQFDGLYNWLRPQIEAEDHSKHGKSP